MAKWTVVSKELFGSKFFRPLSSYAFASRSHLVTVAFGELSRAQACFPVAFVRQENRCTPVVVLGLEPGTNLFVSPEGRWEAPYVPALVRAYPFRLASADQGKAVLCIDEDSQVLHDDPKQGTALFDEQGSPSSFLKEMVQFLQTVDADVKRCFQAAAHLEALELIVPWPLTVKTPEGERTFSGLFQVDETRLMGLSGDDLAALRDSGALSLAFAQRFSVHTLPPLVERYLRRIKTVPPVTSDTIDFSALREDQHPDDPSSPVKASQHEPADPGRSGEDQ